MCDTIVQRHDRGLGNHPTFLTRRYKTHLKNRHDIGGQSEHAASKRGGGIS
jgi:hypothetical protein